MSEKTNDFLKDKISEFDKEVERCIKPLTDYIKSAVKAFEERLRYAVVRDGITQQVTTTKGFAEMLAGKDDELWVAFVNKDNSVSMLAKTDFDWGAKQ